MGYPKTNIFITLKSFDEPRTGGELYYKYLNNYLEDQKNVKITKLDDKDWIIMCKLRGILFLNLKLFMRFVKLPGRSIIIQDQSLSNTYFLANLLLRLIRKRVRIIAIAHETCFQQFHGLSKIKNKLKTFLFYRLADCVIVNSKFIAKEVCSLGGQSRKIKVRLLPGQQFNINDVYKKNNDNRVRILCVANIRPKKGQKYLIEALKILKDFELTATLAGMCKDKSYERDLCSLIKKHGLEERVNFLGWLDKRSISEIYQKSDIFVLPSLYEPLGMVINEAMQYGLPIVASDTGGIPEQVTHMCEALLVPPGNSVALAKAIEKLLCNPNLRERLVKNGYQRLKNLPEWDEVLKNDTSIILSNLK